MIEIFSTPRFDKNYKKLPKEVKLKAEKKEGFFKINPFDLRLNTHRLHGKDKTNWAYWVDYKYRIKFIFLNGSKVLYLDVGTHDEVY